MSINQLKIELLVVNKTINFGPHRSFSVNKNNDKDKDKNKTKIGEEEFTLKHFEETIGISGAQKEGQKGAQDVDDRKSDGQGVTHSQVGHDTDSGKDSGNKVELDADVGVGIENFSDSGVKTESGKSQSTLAPGGGADISTTGPAPNPPVLPQTGESQSGPSQTGESKPSTTTFKPEVIPKNTKEGDDDEGDDDGQTDNTTNNSVLVEEGGYLSDAIIPVASYNLLSLTEESSTVAKEADSTFRIYIMINNLYIVPDESLSHLKDKNNAKHLVAMSGELYVKWSIWKYYVDKFIDTNYNVTKLFRPIPKTYTRELNLVMMSSIQMHTMPMWSLAHLGDDILAKMAYSIAMGGADLIPFVARDHSSMDFTINWSSKVGGLRQVSLKLSEGVKDETTITTTIESKIFDPKNMSSKEFKLRPEKSIYGEDSHKNIMSRIFTLKCETSAISVSQTSVSERTGLVLKGDKVTYDDAFRVSTFVNNDYKFEIQDKYVIDMLLSLFHINKFIENGDHRQDVLNYVCTVIMEYIINGMFIKDNVKLNDLDISIKLDIRDSYNEQARLNSLFLECVNRGKIIPLTHIHFSYYLEKKLDLHAWGPIIFWAALINSRMNGLIDAFSPELDTDSKMVFKMTAINRDMLRTDYYRTRVIPKWQADMQDEISFRQFVKEIYVRSILRDSVPTVFPFFTKGLWSGTNASSWPINYARVHRIYKFGVVDYYNVINSFVPIITLQDDRPKIARTKTRLTESIPPLFAVVVPYDTDDMDVK